jgi:hypothetical protein
MPEPEVLKLDLGKPVEVFLADPDGITEEHQRFGWITKFQLRDGRLLILPVPAGIDLTELRAKPDQRVLILKHSVRGADQKRETVYDMTIIGEPEEEPAAVAELELPGSIMRNGKVTAIDAKSELPSDMERLLAASAQKALDEKAAKAAKVNGTPAVPVETEAPKVETETPPAETKAVEITADMFFCQPPVEITADMFYPVKPLNGNGKRPASVQAPALPRTWREMSIEELLEFANQTSMAKSLMICVGACFIGEQFADKLGYPLRFTSIDVTKLACTHNIGAQQGQRNGNGNGRH